MCQTCLLQLLVPEPSEHHRNPKPSKPSEPIKPRNSKTFETAATFRTVRTHRNSEPPKPSKPRQLSKPGVRNLWNLEPVRTHRNLEPFLEPRNLSDSLASSQEKLNPRNLILHHILFHPRGSSYSSLYIQQFFQQKEGILGSNLQTGFFQFKSPQSESGDPLQDLHGSFQKQVSSAVTLHVSAIFGATESQQASKRSKEKVWKRGVSRPFFELTPPKSQFFESNPKNNFLFREMNEQNMRKNKKSER